MNKFDFLYDKKALIEVGQELVRIACFGAVSALISFGLHQLGLQNQTDTTVVIGTLLLKSLDKYIHDNPNIKANGITDTKLLFK